MGCLSLAKDFCCVLREVTILHAINLAIFETESWLAISLWRHKEITQILLHIVVLIFTRRVVDPFSTPRHRNPPTSTAVEDKHGQTPKHQHQLSRSPHFSFFRLFPLVCKLICWVSSGHRAHNSEGIAISLEQSTQIDTINLEAKWWNPRWTPKIDTAVDRAASSKGRDLNLLLIIKKNIVCKEVGFFGFSQVFSLLLILPSKDPSPKRGKSSIEWYRVWYLGRSLVPRRKRGIHHGSANQSKMFDHWTTHLIGKYSLVARSSQPPASRPNYPNNLNSEAFSVRPALSL